eukprot:jgi/Mesvir1/27087/Mv20773-RA.2
MGGAADISLTFPETDALAAPILDGDSETEEALPCGPWQQVKVCINRSGSACSVLITPQSPQATVGDDHVCKKNKTDLMLKRAVTAPVGSELQWVRLGSRTHVVSVEESQCSSSTQAPLQSALRDGQNGNGVEPSSAAPRSRLVLRFHDASTSDQFGRAITDACCAASAVAKAGHQRVGNGAHGGGNSVAGTVDDNSHEAGRPSPEPLGNSCAMVSSAPGNAFDRKIDAGSAGQYFFYYGQLQHQQNMLQDFTRTGMYYSAILENRVDFEGRAVLDVGCGTGILSFFAAQAGARVVYAVEASDMARHARALAAANPTYSDIVKVIQGKVEEVSLPEKVDIIVSEPVGTLLVNERMIESYVVARDRFLKPGGKMYPSEGRIFVMPFSDEQLHWEISSKAVFWQQNNFFSVDLSPLFKQARATFFSQPVVDAFDPHVLACGAPVAHRIDFASIQEKELQDISIPLSFRANAALRLHGLACWFDFSFLGSSSTRCLSTAPGLPVTHWFQMRLVLEEPLVATPGAQVTGMLHLVAHERQSYHMHVVLATPALPGVPVVNSTPQASAQGGNWDGWEAPTGWHVSRGYFDLKDPYYRQMHSSGGSGSGWYQNLWGQDGEFHPQNSSQPDAPGADQA